MSKLKGEFVELVNASEAHCASQLLGPWAVEPTWFGAAWSQVQGMSLRDVRAANPPAAPQPEADHGDLGDGPSFPFTVVNGTAIIPVQGPLSKHPHSFQSMFGGSATAGIRKMVRMAVSSDKVTSILFHIDSPGGTVHGNGDLGDDVEMAGLHKPTIAFIEDLGASAAYWIASKTNHIMANHHAVVGSIGAIMVLHDMSKQAEQEGIRVVAIRSADKKARPQPGEEVTAEIEAEYQAKIDALGKEFTQIVADGRGMSFAEAKKLSTGEVWTATEAMSLGLIDSIGNIDDAFKLAQEAGQAVSEDEVVE